jgi:phytoene dehydrogenase-like protein
MKTALVIGSGVSGLTAAIVLARSGYRVTLLEQSPRPGGLLGRFQRQGLSYSIGVHCIGAMGPGQTLRHYLEYLGVWSRIRPVEMKAEGFLQYCFPDFTFDMPGDHGRFGEALLARFPEERAGIERYFADMAATVSRFPLYRLSQGSYPELANVDFSLSTYLGQLTGSEPLRRVLAAPNLLYGVPTDECPLFLHFLVTDSVLQSSWRIDESQTSLVDAFLAALAEAGGGCRTDCQVVGLECQGTRTTGVRLATGEEISGDVVVFTGHPKLLPSLCPSGTLRPAFRGRIAEAEETLGIFGVALEWRTEDFPLARQDVVLYGSRSVDAVYRQRVVGRGGRPEVVYCTGSPTGRDGVYAGQALSGCAPEEFGPWWESRTGRRPADYMRVKEELASGLMAAVCERWPRARTEARVVDVFTPLTFRDYAGTPTGSALGLKKSLGSLRSSWLSTRTRIANLFLAGQSVLTPGIMGALISGIAASGAILGRDSLMTEVVKERA